MGLWDAQFEVFKTMTPPLRPHISEIEIMQGLVNSLKESGDGCPPQALILGLTPEYLGLDWPEESRVVVVDRSRHVAQEWWPGDIPGRRELVMSDWLEMPFDDREFDLILGDGVFNFMTYPIGFKTFSMDLSRLLRPGGLLGVRVFALPDPPEDPEELVAEFYRSDEIDYFGYRFRIAQSIQETPEQGLFLNKDTVDTWLSENGVDLNQLYEKSGHTPPKVAPLPQETVDTFRVSYPTEAQFEGLLGAHFIIRQKLYGNHRQAERTPIYTAAPAI